MFMFTLPRAGSEGLSYRPAEVCGCGSGLDCGLSGSVKIHGLCYDGFWSGQLMPSFGVGALLRAAHVAD